MKRKRCYGTGPAGITLSALALFFMSAVAAAVVVPVPDVEPMLARLEKHCPGLEQLSQYTDLREFKELPETDGTREPLLLEALAMIEHVRRALPRNCKLALLTNSIEGTDYILTRVPERSQLALNTSFYAASALLQFAVYGHPEGKDRLLARADALMAAYLRPDVELPDGTTLTSQSIDSMGHVAVAQAYMDAAALADSPADAHALLLKAIDVANTFANCRKAMPSDSVV